MLFQYNLYFLILSITVIISTTVAFAAWQRRSTSLASKPFISMMLAIAGYATVAAMEAAAILLREKIFWSKLEYVGSGSVITLFLIFAMQFTNKNQFCLVGSMDIDYFKNINDTFGHQAGDRVIQVFADLLRNYSDSQNIVCRYGGEEFVLALPGLTQEKAFQHAEQIRLSFQAARLESGGKEIHTTVSGGVAVFPDHGKTTDELLQVVDQALYAATLHGRNCIKRVQSS